MRKTIIASADDWTVTFPQKRKSTVKKKRESLLANFCRNKCPHADNPTACDCEEFLAYRKSIAKKRRKKV